MKLEKENIFLDHVRELNEIDAKNNKATEKELKLIRNPERRNTDGFIGVKLIEKPVRTDIGLRLELKEELLVKYQAQDIIGIPIYDRNLHTSFIYDRMANDEIVEKKRVLNIDPTDKRYNFDNEIQRFVNEQENKNGDDKNEKKADKNHNSRESAFSSYIGKFKYW